MNSYFVTGTDTGVGKTVTSAILSAGLGYHYWKPIQTGLPEDRDTDFVGQWVDKTKIIPELYSFREPASPHIAAALEQSEINFARCVDRFQQIPKPVIVEGAGGLMVPLNSKKLQIDWIAETRIPVILVASTRLGTINHTLLSLEALKARSIPIAGIIAMGTSNPAVTNSFTQFGEVPLLGEIEFTPAFSRDWIETSFKKIKLPD